MNPLLPVPQTGRLRCDHPEELHRPNQQQDDGNVEQGSTKIGREKEQQTPILQRGEPRGVAQRGQHDHGSEQEFLRDALVSLSCSPVMRS